MTVTIEGREHELFARFIKNNTEIDGRLFTLKADIEGFDNIDKLIRSYNESLYYRHANRKLKEFNGHIYIAGYAEDSTKIVKKLQELASSGVSQYTASVDSWIQKESYMIDDVSKKEALRQMFAVSVKSDPHRLQPSFRFIMPA